MGGSDVMEVAGLAKPILVGPHTDNFAEAVDILLGAGAAQRVERADGLAAAVAELLRDETGRARRGLAGRRAIIARRGATERTVDQVLNLSSQP
jgi:3-deoxy-D-manno-octulosonic-acid transferase